MSSDTLRTGKQAREDTAMALIEAGLTKSMSHLQLDSLEDIEHLYATVRQMGPNAIYVFRVPREVAERGQISGATAAILISGLPENVLGGVMLSFDGWADDSRELFQIPCVVDFCYGLIKGNIPDLATGKRALSYLVDEGDLVEKIGVQGWDAAGRLWACGTAFPMLSMFDLHSPPLGGSGTSARQETSSTGLWARAQGHLLSNPQPESTHGNRN